MELTIVGPLGFGAAALTIGGFERFLRHKALQNRPRVEANPPVARLPDAPPR